MIFNVAESTTGFPFDLTKVQIVVREREIHEKRLSIFFLRALLFKCLEQANLMFGLLDINEHGHFELY